MFSQSMDLDKCFGSKYKKKKKKEEMLQYNEVESDF